MPNAPLVQIDLECARGGAFARSCNAPKMSASRTRHRRGNLARTVLPVLLVWLLSPTGVAQDDAASPPLSYLSYYDDLRLEAAAVSGQKEAGVTTEPLNNEVMRFTMPDDGDTYYLRHLTAMDAITIDGVTAEFKSVGAVLMAVHHWNNKVSAVVPVPLEIYYRVLRYGLFAPQGGGPSHTRRCAAKQVGAAGPFAAVSDCFDGRRPIGSECSIGNTCRRTRADSGFVRLDLDLVRQQGPISNIWSRHTIGNR